jgi:3-deoxy-D-manno-octulosonic-acid transferase
MIFYHIISTIGTLAVAPLFTLYSLFTGSKRRGLWHHFGRVPVSKKSPAQKTLWLYALSLGEVTAAAPVLKIIHEEHPDIRLVVSVTTDTGYDGALQKIPFADSIFFHPLDCLPFTMTALNRIRPDAFVMTDTGFWPGLLDLLTGRGIPSLLFNGRISKRSLKRYQQLGKFSQNLFNGFDTLCMQNEDGKNALQTLGVELSRLKVIGDPKFDALVPVPDEDRIKIRSGLDIPSASPVWVAGSTHAGEEEIILEVYQNLKHRFDALVLILAPRRLERIGEVESLLKARNIPFVISTSIGEHSVGRYPVILLDTMGELSKLFSIGDVAFVGHSLIAPGGGHSLMEPVAHGKAVVHGPHIENFRQVAEELRKLNLAYPVSNADEMATVVTSLLGDASKRNGLAEKATAWTQAYKGASRRMADIILGTLKD